MSCGETVIDCVISASQGDLRRAINLLQSTNHLKGSEEVTQQDIIEIAGVCVCHDIIAGVICYPAFRMLSSYLKLNAHAS